MRHGSVRFGSVRFRVRFRPVPELNGLVRFGLAGSVGFLIPSFNYKHCCDEGVGGGQHQAGALIGLESYGGGRGYVLGGTRKRSDVLFKYVARGLCFLTAHCFS